MIENKTLYQRILKSTTLFGGVQIFNILVSVLRSKIIALLIGPEGMGIAGLLNSAINLINGFTSLGIETSAVKYISKENTEADKTGLHKIISVLRQLVWLTGLLGAFATLAFSPWLSGITFGTQDYTIWFAWLSVTLLFKQLSAGQLALLQGFQKLQSLAKANLYGSLVGLVISAPLYYYFRTDAIVPAIIVSALCTLYFSWFYASEIKIETEKVPYKQMLIEGKGMLKLGIMLSLSGIIATVVAYIIQIYVTQKGGLEEVGLYNAGFLLLNSYVGLIFTAMATDYFPRLASVSDNNEEVRTTVTHQAMIAVLLITPVIVLFLAFAPIIVNLLYSDKFLAIVPMVCFGIIGMLFRAVSWSMGYILLAKGDSKMFIRTAFGFNALFFTLSLSGYYLYGLTGLGVAFTIHYFLHFVLLKVITLRRYEFYFSDGFGKIFFICIVLSGLAFVATFIENVFWYYGTMAALILASVLFSLSELNKKVDFAGMVNRFKEKE
jgi:O-antigen/teichoic acid export membrane protein